MPTIELPEFGTAQTNENEPTIALKQSGWANGDQPPASILNWLSRSTYDSLRAMLGLHLTNLVDKFDTGPVVSPSTSYDIEGIGIDAGGHVLVVSRATTNVAIYRSTDNGASYASVHSGGSAVGYDAVMISDGVYAVIPEGSNGTYLYASYPYTSWSSVTHAWGGNVVDFMLADIGDGHGPSMLVLTDAGSIWVADATSAPTVTGDWTQYDISSVMDTPTSFALDRENGILVVAGSDSGGGGGLTAWCDIANGVAAGDFSTPVDHSSSKVATIAHNGERFVIVISPSEDMKWSTDGQSWTNIINDTGLISATNQTLLGDLSSGFFFLFDGETGSAACSIAVSRDGIFWIIATTSAQNIYVNGWRGRAPKLHPIVNRFIVRSYNAGGTVGYLPSQTL